MSQEPVQIAIIVEGGIVQAVLSAGVRVEYTLVDYDCDDSPEGILSDVPQEVGGTQKAVVITDEAYPNGPLVQTLRELA